VKAKAWKLGAAGGSTSGQTLLRATGLAPSFTTPHAASVPT
jgi:hypothetical protein